METNRKIREARIVAYYLSKFGDKALENLGYEKWNDAYNDIGNRLGYKPASINNRRDDFDAVNDNGRRGWWKQEIPKLSLEVLEEFGHLSEDALTEIIKEILFSELENISSILGLPDVKEASSKDQSYNNRGITGRKAEELFKDYFNSGFFSDLKGDLVDTRDEGCGYDFKLVRDSIIVFEVKGLASESGGVSFTDKEWSVAKQLRDNYILIIISNVFANPEVKIMVDPYGKITPVKRMTKVISVNWTFQSKDLT
jgi:hypothetical protein